MAERTKMRNMEITAISEAISILNDDDSLDVFKKALPSSFVQQTAFLQKGDKTASRARQAEALLAGVAGKQKDVRLNLLLYTLGSKLKMKSAGGFDDVIKMIDDMVVLLGKQQKEDEKQKA